MHGSHLTCRNGSWIFQCRVPAAFAKSFPSFPIQMMIGHVSKRIAQRAARHLWLVADDAIRELGAMPLGGATHAENGKAVRRKLEAYLPAFLALDFNPADLPAGHEREAVEASLDGLVDLCGRELSGIDPVPAPHRAVLDRHYGSLVKDESLARAHLGLPPAVRPAADQVMSQLLAAVTAMQQQGEATAAELRAFKASRAPKVGPLFSEAADTYYDEMATTRGAHHDELKYIRHRKAVFIAICGDRPVTAYTAADLQTFMNRVRFLAPNQSKLPGYDVANVIEYIAEAEASGAKGLAESTLVNNYVAKIRTIIRAACNAAELPYTLGGRRLKVPKGVPKPKAKFLVDHDAANRLFAAAAGSGLLAETMLPLLGYLTGRRLGLLAFVRGEDIHQHDGVWMVTPRDIVRDDQGYWVTVPFKTGESLTSFVLHNLLVRTGFVDWARRRKGFIFSSLHETKDPADTASKRMCRLYDKAGIDSEIYKMFHGLRHAKIACDRDLGIASRTTRLQVGHELLDVHDAYGGMQMRRSELHTIAYAELPPEIDFAAFAGLDFDRLAAARSGVGRPTKCAALAKKGGQKLAAGCPR